jgi:hypothetical protein
VELLLSLIYSVTILAVDDEDKALRAGVIVAPEGSNLVLTTDVPHVEFDVLVRDSLNVEANWRTSVIAEAGPRHERTSRDGRDGLVELQLV